MDGFEQQIQEAMSNASYMDVSELRTLYYGRLGIHVAFSDNADIPKGGFSENELVKPYSITAHTVDTVVGRKAHTHYYYGHVFRIKKSGVFLEDIKSYNTEDLKEDIEALRVIPHIVPEDLESALERVSSNPRFRYPFARMWAITKEIASHKGRYADKYWRRILIDLGYSGFNDPRGIGVIGERNQQTTLLLEFDLEEFDIVPVQKYRKDKRQRIIDAVNKKNRINHTRRNRVAKKKTDPYRDYESRSKRFMKDLIKTIGIMGGM